MSKTTEDRLKDRSYREIETALAKQGYVTEKNIARYVTFRIDGKHVIVKVEMAGMGHNETSSYRSRAFTEKELFPE